MLAMLGMPKWIIIAVIAALSAAAGAAGMAKIKNGEIDGIHLAHAQALIAAERQARETQKAIDKVAMDAAVADAEAQVKIVETTKTIVKEIPRYVQDTSTCITVGLVRVLDAAALGADPADLDLAPGEFNEACAGIGAHALATSVAENYGRARADAQQLTGLQDYVNALQVKMAVASPTD